MTAPVVETQTLELSTAISAPVEFVWSMLSNRDDLCDWLCSDAHLRFREGGFATFIWRDPPTYEDGPHAYGIYKTIIENEKIVMTWHDGTDQVTKVKFLIDQDDEDMFTLKVWHKGFTDETRAAHYQSFWEEHLSTLKRMLETGERPDIADRVVIGVMVDGSESSDAGQRVTNVIDGYSAEKAGIKAGDIIVEVAGTTLDEDTGIHALTRGKRPGDELTIGFIRDGEKHFVTATLAGHPMPPIPTTFEEMAQHHQDEYDRINAALEIALDGVTNDVATFKPDDSDTEWNINQTLAHMILNQRHTLEWLSTYAHGPRRINGYYSEPARITAIVSTYGDPQALLAELKAKQQETIGMIHAFDKAMEKRLDYMWWMVFEIWWTENTSMRCVSEIEELAAHAVTG